MNDARRCQVIQGSETATNRHAPGPFVTPAPPLLTPDQEERFARKLAAEVRAHRVPRQEMQYARIFSAADHSVVVRELRFRRARALVERLAWVLAGAASCAALARLFV